MVAFLYVIVVCEMLFVNLTTVHICVPKKVSTPRIIAVMCLFTVAIIGLGMPFVSSTPYYGNGNGLFVIAGFLYLIPLRFLYNAKLSYILEVACTSWVYTMLAFSLGAQIGRAFPKESFPLVLFVVQTAFYLATVAIFWRFIRDKFVYILDNIPEKTRKYLRYGCVIWFFAIITINLSFVASDRVVARVSALLFFAAVSYVSYALLYEITKSSNDAIKMKKMANTDHLTGLPNRYRLWEDYGENSSGGAPFHVVYMDLDRFKTINDKYGHLVGDRYLIMFARHIQNEVKECGTLYRISGDEFLLICKNISLSHEDIERRISQVTFQDKVFGSFLGVSTGVATCPQDGSDLDKLIAVADGRMYQNKSGRAAVEGRPR